MQSGSQTFNIVNNKITLTAAAEDVKVLIRKRNGVLPMITSLVIMDGALPGEAKRQELCQLDCGLRDSAIANIRGGTEAREGAWPWNAG